MTGTHPQLHLPRGAVLWDVGLGAAGTNVLEVDEIPEGGTETSISACCSRIRRARICRGEWLSRGCQSTVRAEDLSVPKEVTARGPTIRAGSPRGLLDAGGDTAASTGVFEGTSWAPSSEG